MRIAALRRVLGLSPWAVDAIVAAVIAVVAYFDVQEMLDAGASVFPAVVMGAVTPVTMLLRRRYPLAVNIVGLSLIGVLALNTPYAEDVDAPFLSLIVIPYAAGAWTDRGAWVLLFPLAAIACVNATAEEVLLGDYLFPGGIAVASWATGRVLRTRTQLAAELHEASVRAEEAHEAELARATADERRRIAREMHDIVAHSVSVMVVQAGGARRILERDPQRANDAAAQIERTGREALTEMRRLLGVFGAEGAVREPQPGLEQLDRLVERAREGGLPVSVHVEGDQRPLPTGLDLTMYRVIQEALTNVLKHAGPARTDVHVDYGADAVRVVVRNDRAAQEAARHELGGSGHGIAGLRERVRLFGGEFEALPRPDGGFVVRATLPLESVEEQAGHTVEAAA